MLDLFQPPAVAPVSAKRVPLMTSRDDARHEALKKARQASADARRLEPEERLRRRRETVNKYRSKLRKAKLMQINIKRIRPGAVIPERATEGAAGFDLCAVIEGNPVTVRSGIPAVIPTGLSVEIPPGYAMLILSRSGHGFKADTRLANCVGLIDSDYRGEIMVKLTRDASIADPLVVRNGDRIAQAVIIPFLAAQFVEAESLTDTARGAGGFGSTGA